MNSLILLTTIYIASSTVLGGFTGGSGGGSYDGSMGSGYYGGSSGGGANVLQGVISGIFNVGGGSPSGGGGASSGYGYGGGDGSGGMASSGGGNYRIGQAYLLHALHRNDAVAAHGSAGRKTGGSATGGKKIILIAVEGGAAGNAGKGWQ